MAYKCLKCNHIFEEGEQVVRSEYHSEYWGEQVYESVSRCPCCLSDEYEHTVRCKRCGGEFLEEELAEGGCCSDCVDRITSAYRYDISGCYHLSRASDLRAIVRVDGFLASMFSQEEINRILLRELVGAACVSPVDCTEFIEANKDWFVEKVNGGDGE